MCLRERESEEEKERVEKTIFLRWLPEIRMSEDWFVSSQQEREQQQQPFVQVDSEKIVTLILRDARKCRPGDIRIGAAAAAAKEEEEDNKETVASLAKRRSSRRR